MKKILYLSFYFEPDLCAGSFRNSPLVHELAKQTRGIATIDLITTLPNRYNTYSVDAKDNEVIEGLRIVRVKLSTHKNGFKDQALAFGHYYLQVQEFVKEKDYDLVVASSSRLFTAYLAHRVAKRKQAKLYLDIRDIFTDTLNDVIKNKLIKLLLLPVLRVLEKQTFQSANHINLISPGFKMYFHKYVTPNYSYFTNGIDPEFIKVLDYGEELPDKPIVITYAGNIGEGQGLHKIIPYAATVLGNNYFFRVIGDGGAKDKLQEKIHQFGVKNVILERPVKRSELLKIYNQSHYLFMHLNDYAAFEKVLPSKVFELGAFPRPFIAGVKGFASEFIKTNLSDFILFAPGHVDDFCKKLMAYQYKIPFRYKFIQEFNRENINQKMVASIMSYLD